MMGVINLKWRDAMAECGRLFNKDEQNDGWPDSMRPDQIAYLQRPWQGVNKLAKDKYRKLNDHIDAACESGSLKSSTVMQKMPHQITTLVPGDPRFALRNAYGERELKPRQTLVWESKEVQAKVIPAPAFAAWLAGQGETPSVHIAAWCAAVGADSEPQAAPVQAETPKQRRARLLDLYGEGERGAVQRVYERELLTNPKADRSNIGKEIEKAKQEKKEAKQGGSMFSQLVQDGKRVN